MYTGHTACCDHVRIRSQRPLMRGKEDKKRVLRGQLVGVRGDHLGRVCVSV